jgi:ankyrin repeat protein
LHNYYAHINTTPLAVYRYLIETKGCDVNAQNKFNNTPLYHALGPFDPNKGGDMTVLMYLLTQTNINVNIKNYFGDTVLHAACQRINKLPLEIFRNLIESQGADVNVQSNYNNTPLHYAIECFDPRNGGDINVLYYLLNQKAVNVDIKGWDGHTLLHMACKYINILSLGIFKVLIEKHGADVNAQNNDKNTPLHCAFREFNPNEGGDITALTYLLCWGGVKINIKGYYGYTLLHSACEEINRLPLDVFKVLIETCGADVNAQDNIKYTPLHNALRNFDPNKGGNIKVLAYLLNQKGIDVNMMGLYCSTLLHTACKKINTLPLDVFKLLIETQGCDVNAQDDDEDTPLHLALRYFHAYNSGVITTLIYLIDQNNFNVNIKDQDGRTFLHSACKWDISNLKNVSDSEDDGNVLEAKSDTGLSQIVEIIAERCVEQVFDESSS